MTVVKAPVDEAVRIAETLLCDVYGRTIGLTNPQAFGERFRTTVVRCDVAAGSDLPSTLIVKRSDPTESPTFTDADRRFFNEAAALSFLQTLDLETAVARSFTRQVRRNG